MDDVLKAFNPWWSDTYKFESVRRERYLNEMKRYQQQDQVIFLVGMRRVGKTTLMKQFILDNLRSMEAKRVLFISMDHPQFQGHSIIDIVNRFRSIHGLSGSDRILVLLDEVHLHDGFERDLKVLHDMEHTKIYASGSASIFLLEKGSYLTGRQHFIDIQPFDLAEYLTYIGPDKNSLDKERYIRIAEEHVLFGGLPEYLRTKDPGYVLGLVDSIIYKDLVSRHSVGNVRALKDIVLFLSQSIGNRLGARKMGRILGISHQSVLDYISFFKETKMIDLVEREGKVSVRKASPEKIYFADTGMVRVLSPTVNIGALVENIVHNHIRRTAEPRYHYESGKEIDFVFGDTAVEVKYKDQIADEELRPLRSLKGYSKKMIVSKSVETRKDDVNIVPLWKFLTEH